MSGGVLGSLAVAAVTLTLAYAAYRDLVSREVPEAVWVPAYLLAVLSAAFGPRPSYSTIGAVLALLPAAVYGILFALKLLGGADLLAMLLVAVAHLSEPLVPLATFALSSLAPLPMILANLVGNVMTGRRAIMDSISCARGSKRLLYIVGMPVTVAEFLLKRFAFLHTFPSQSGLVCSSGADVDVDFEEQRAALVRAVEERLIRLEDYVVYSPAIPHVALIAVSYVVAVLVAPYLRALAPLP